MDSNLVYLNWFYIFYLKHFYENGLDLNITKKPNNLAIK